MNFAEFNKCIDKYSDLVCRYVKRLVNNNDDIARDITQDTIESLWLNHTKIEFDKGSSYFFTVAHNKTMNYLVSRNNNQINITRIPEINHHGHQYSDLKEILDKATDRLPIMQKKVFLLRHYYGYNYEEIGKMTGLKEAQVRDNIFKAKETLKNYLCRVEAII